MCVPVQIMEGQGPVTFSWHKSEARQTPGALEIKSHSSVLSWMDVILFTSSLKENFPLEPSLSPGAGPQLFLILAEF